MLAKYEPRGLLALDQRAFGMLLIGPPPPPENEEIGGAQVVTIRGPLMHHADPLCDNYDAIRARVVEGLSKGPKALVLRIDSPGGLVAGCFELANDIQRLAAAAKVPVLAYVEGQACSAAYALACAAERIHVSTTAAIGSIGILDVLVDATKADAAMGLRYTLVASGARKTDGNPHAETSEEAVRAAEARVEALAEIFFDFVATSRARADASKARSLEASVVHGVTAEKLGLADAVGSFDQMLASIASADSRPATADNSEGAMDEEKMRASLQATIDDEKSDEKAKAKARRMLAAMDESGDDEDEKAKAAKAQADEDEKAKAAKAESDKKDEEARAAAAAAAAKAQGGDEDAKAIAFRALGEAHALRAERAAEKEALERQQLLASRPDFATDIVDFLAKASIEQVRDAVKNFKRGPVRASAGAAALAGAVTPAATRGEGQVDGATAPDHELDVKLGLARATSAIKHDGNALKLGVMTRAESIAFQKARAEQTAKAANAAR